MKRILIAAILALCLSPWETFSPSAAPPMPRAFFRPASCRTTSDWGR